jgi:hypothetical protein
MASKNSAAISINDYGEVVGWAEFGLTGAAAAHLMFGLPQAPLSSKNPLARSLRSRSTPESVLSTAILVVGAGLRAWNGVKTERFCAKEYFETVHF